MEEDRAATDEAVALEPTGGAKAHHRAVPMRQEQSLEPAVVPYWRLARTGRALSTAAYPFIFGWIASVSGADWGGPVMGGAAALGALGSVWAVVSARLEYDRARYRIEADRMWFRSGVLVHREKIVPLDRMQHVDVEQGPLERWLHLSSFSVFTAGGRSAAYRLEGVSPERARELRDFVLQQRGEAAT